MLWPVTWVLPTHWSVKLVVDARHELDGNPRHLRDRGHWQYRLHEPRLLLGLYGYGVAHALQYLAMGVRF